MVLLRLKLNVILQDTSTRIHDMYPCEPACRYTDPRLLRNTSRPCLAHLLSAPFNPNPPLPPPFSLPLSLSPYSSLLITLEILTISSLPSLSSTILPDRNLDTLRRKALTQRRALLDSRELLGGPHGKDVGEAGRQDRRDFVVEGSVRLADVDEGEFETVRDC